MTRVIEFFRAFLLLELFRGLALTGRHLRLGLVVVSL